MPIDPRLIFMFLVFATVFSFGQAAWGLFGARQTRQGVFSLNVARTILEDIVAQEERLFILMKSRLLFA